MQIEINQRDLYNLPSGLPVPTDDGATDHLVGTTLPPIELTATDGEKYNLQQLASRPTVFFFYPRTGQPHEPAPEGWDEIPGARGCTLQSFAYRDKYTEFDDLGVQIFGVSVQTTTYQKEFSERNAIPFLLLSDCEYQWVNAANLPTFDFNGLRLTKRFTLFASDGVIQKVFYPVFPSDKDAETVLAWLKESRGSESC